MNPTENKIKIMKIPDKIVEHDFVRSNELVEKYNELIEYIEAVAQPIIVIRLPIGNMSRSVANDIIQETRKNLVADPVHSYIIPVGEKQDVSVECIHPKHPDDADEIECKLRKIEQDVSEYLNQQANDNRDKR